MWMVFWCCVWWCMCWCGWWCVEDEDGGWLWQCVTLLGDVECDVVLWCYVVMLCCDMCNGVSGVECCGKVEWLILSCLGVLVSDTQTDGRTNRHGWLYSRFCNWKLVHKQTDGWTLIVAIMTEKPGCRLHSSMFWIITDSKFSDYFFPYVKYNYHFDIHSYFIGQ